MLVLVVVMKKGVFIIEVCMIKDVKDGYVCNV